MKSARMGGERFFVKTRFGKRRNTLCTRKGYAASVGQQSCRRLRNISSFPNRWIGGKDSVSAAADLFSGFSIKSIVVR